MTKRKISSAYAKPVFLVNSKGNPFYDNLAVNAIPTMTVPHILLEQGKMFTAQYLDEDVGIDQADNILVRTNGNHVHMYFVFGSSLTSRLEVFEEPTITDDGSELKTTNRNRTKSDISQVSLFSTPTIGDDGVLIFQTILLGGDKKAHLGDMRSDSDGLILKSATDYLFRITNLSGAGSGYDVFSFYWEEG